MVKPSLKITKSSYAHRLKAAAGVERLLLMTDAARLPDPEVAISSLPADSIVIFRDYDHAERATLATYLLKISRSAGCWFLVAGDVQLARRIGADGVHLPEYMVGKQSLNLNGFSLVTAACHSIAALRRAQRAGAYLAVVSPVFPTKSHPGVKTLGVHGLSRLIAATNLPVAALGGISIKNARKLRALKLAGVAGISGITG